LERSHPDDHPDLARARTHLALTRAVLGDLEGAHELGADLARAMLARLERAMLRSPREAREGARAEAEELPTVQYFLRIAEDEDAPGLGFELSETLRLVSQGPSLTGGNDDPDVARLRAEVESLRTRITALVAGGRPAESAEGSLSDRLGRLVRDRDERERRLREVLLEDRELAGPIRAADVARGLSPDEAAVGFSRLRTFARDTTTGFVLPTGETLLARVVRADGTLNEVDLGRAVEIEALADRWRAALGRPLRSRGLTSVSTTRSEEGELVEIGTALRERVLDPVLARLDEEVGVLHVALDDFLHVVPLDALPDGGGAVGDRRRVVTETSFARLSIPSWSASARCSRRGSRARPSSLWVAR
jgi:hypothetical protein